MEREWFNFENSLNSPQTKRQYVFCLKQFLIFTKNFFSYLLKVQDATARRIKPKEGTNFVL